MLRPAARHGGPARRRHHEGRAGQAQRGRSGERGQHCLLHGAQRHQVQGVQEEAEDRWGLLSCLSCLQAFAFLSFYLPGLKYDQCWGLRHLCFLSLEVGTLFSDFGCAICIFECAPSSDNRSSNNFEVVIRRAGHFRYLKIFSIIKNDFLAFFIKLITYFCTSPT